MISLITKREWFVNDPRIQCFTPDVAPAVMDFLLSHQELAFDSEASGLDVHTISHFCVQFGVPGHQIIADCRVLPISFWKPLLETKKLIGVNLKYDVKLLFKQGIRPTSVEDLMLNEILLTNGLYDIKETKGKFSFEGLSEQYLKDTDVNKTIGASFSVKPPGEPLTVAEVLYAAKDVSNPLLIWKKQQQKIKDKELEAVCNLENRALFPIAEMEYNGLPLDTEKWKAAHAIIDERFRQADKELNEYAAGTPLKDMKIRVGKNQVPAVYSYEGLSGPVVKANINWASTDQVLEVFQKLGIQVESTDQDTLLPLKDRSKMVSLYLQWNKYDTLKSKFMDKMMGYVNPVTGCVHPDFWQIVSTGRMSCNNPNLQQMPSKGEEANLIRNCFVAGKGEKLVDADLSSAELRIIAEASQDPLWLQIYRDDGDLHSIICARLFKIPVEDVKKPFPLKPDMKYRDVIKIISFGLAYGMTEYKLANTVGCTVDEARTIIDDYFKVVPKVKQLLDGYGKQVCEHFVAYTLPPICRPRFFDRRKLHYPGARPSRILGEIERAGKNSPIQGSNADWIKIALVLIYEYIQQHHYPAKLRLVIHDEIITSVPDEKAEEWAKIQAALMEQAGSYIIKSIPVKAETQILDYWAK